MTATYPPALYALVHRGSPGDVAFYREQCADGDRVLELGCGYGRVLEALIDAGRNVVGLDRDADLLALARERHHMRVAAGQPGLALVRGDMRRLGFARKFDRIFIPFTGIYCLPSHADCVACLRSCAEHLTLDGRLVFDAYPGDALQADLDVYPEEDVLNGEFESIVNVEWQGDAYEVSERSVCGRAPQTLDVTYRYASETKGAETFGHITHHYWLREQVGPILKEAGLRVLGMYGDFKGGELADDSENLVVIAARA